LGHPIGGHRLYARRDALVGETIKGETVKTIRTITISILAVGMVAGSGIGVTAQDVDPQTLTPTGVMAPAHVTGSWAIDDCVYDGTIDIPPADVSITDQGVAQTRGLIRCASIEASDPRLRAADVFPVGFSSDIHFPEEDLWLYVESTAIEFANDGGSWTGLSTSTQGDDYAEMIVLTGADGYEGLTAVLFVRDREGDSEEMDQEMDEEDIGAGSPFTGAIFPGEVPVPEPYAAQ
jgi:hypothetical protein